MWIRIRPTFYSDAGSDPDPTFQFDADPNPNPTTHFFPSLDPSMLQNVPLRLSAFHFDVDSDPDPVFHCAADAAPDPDQALHFDAVRIRICIRLPMRIRFRSTYV